MRILLLSLTLGAVLASSACDKKDSKAPVAKTETAPTPAPAGQEVAAAAAEAKNAVADLEKSANALEQKLPPVGPPVTDAQIDAMAKRVGDFMMQVAVIADANKADCKKMASAIEKLFEGKQPFFDEIKSFDARMTTEQKSSLGGKMETTQKGFSEKFLPAVQGCASDKESTDKLMSLFSKLT